MPTKRRQARDRPRAIDLLDCVAATAADQGWSEVFAGIERLRELAVGTAAGEPTRRKVFRREGEYWTVAYEGSLVRLQDSKGEGHANH